MSKSLFALSLTLSLTLVACQTQPLGQQQSPTQAKTLSPDAAVHYPARTKTEATGAVKIIGQTLTLTLKLPQLPSPSHNHTDFATQKLDLSTATKLFAQVTDSHGETYTPVGADGNGAVNYSAGTITLTFNNVVPDELLFVEVQAKNGTTDIPQADLATVLKHTSSASPVNTTLNFQTTVAAKAMKALLTADATRARSINLTDLDTLTTSITGVTGTSPNLTYPQKHPSLVNTALLATDLQTQLPNTLTAADYRQNVGTTVNLTVSGLTGTDKVQVQITDAASAIQTNLGNGSTNLTGVTPGSGLSAIVTPFGTPSQSYTYTMNPTSLSLTEGNTNNLTVTASPTLQVSNITPSAGTPGTQITITGTGFNGISAPNGVSFSGANASYVVNSDTQITATVPTAAIDGPITITKGATSIDSTAFDAYRIIFVKANASGANSGRSWADAHPSLQSAILAAVSNDQIWIAAGTYKPATQNDSFNVNEGVKIYGGFAGNETTLAARNPATNPVILSGDLGNDDGSYTQVPFTTDTDNVNTIVIADSDGTLDGVTVQGARSCGLSVAGNHSPVLNNLIIKNNNRDRTGNGGRGAGIRFHNGARPYLSNTVFSENFASQFGGGIYISDSSPLLFEKLVFKKNKAPQGSAIDIQIVPQSFTISRVVVVENTATDSMNFYANLYNNSSTPITLTLSNVLIANNISQGEDTRIAGDGYATFVANNVTVANNTVEGGGFSTFSEFSGPSTVHNNFLIWKNAVARTPDSGSGNIDLGTGGSPFLNPADPDGADNLWFTADDGFNFANGTVNGVNDGVTGTGIPATDIVDRGRNGIIDSGAYEYTP